MKQTMPEHPGSFHHYMFSSFDHDTIPFRETAVIDEKNLAVTSITRRIEPQDKEKYIYPNDDYTFLTYIEKDCRRSQTRYSYVAVYPSHINDHNFSVHVHLYDPTISPKRIVLYFYATDTETLTRIFCLVEDWHYEFADIRWGNLSIGLSDWPHYLRPRQPANCSLWNELPAPTERDPNEDVWPF